MTAWATSASREVHVDRSEEILTESALDFVADLHRRFGARRDELLAARRTRRTAIAETGTLDFLPETADVRTGDWRVAPTPGDLQDRRVEITGPTTRKMSINALNSGAKVWLADLEDANTPHWENVIGGQVNLYDAVRRDISFTSPEGKDYALADPEQIPVIVPRPRGWHLDEAHITVDGSRIAGGLVDFGLYFFHNATRAAVARLRAVLLPAQDGVAPRGPVVERRVHPRPVGARGPARDHPRHGADRDHHRGVRDGRDPLRAARPHGGPERGAVGLPVQHHQELP